MKLKILLGLMLIAPFTFAAEEEKEKSKHSWYFEPSVSTDKEFNSVSSGLYVAYGYKIDDLWKLTADFGGSLKNADFDKSDWKLSHSYVRPKLSRKDFFKIGNNSFGLDVRWRIPTASSAQEQGTFGQINLRFPTSGKYTEKIGYFLRPSLNVNMPKNGYSNKLTETKKAGVVTAKEYKGNSLANISVEYQISFALPHGFSIAPYYAVGAGVAMPSRVTLGTAKEEWKESFSIFHEYELDYSLNKKVTLTVSVDESSSFDSDFDVKLFNPDNFGYNFKVKYSY